MKLLASGKTIGLSLQDEPQAFFDYKAIVDKDGKFVFTHVPSDMKNPYAYRQIVVTSRGGSMTTTSAFIHRITLKPGETTTGDIGGTGRPIIGKLVAPPGYTKPISNWNKGRTALEREVVGPAGKEMEYHGFAILADGSFRIEDVTPGIYRLKCQVVEEGKEAWKAGPVIGTLTKDIVIEAMEGGRSDKAFDLGELKLK